MLRRLLPSPTPWLALAALLSTSLACKDEEQAIEVQDQPREMAAAYCSALFECPCNMYPYGSSQECYSELFTIYETLNDEAATAGLIYDSSCPPIELDLLDELGCSVAPPSLPPGVCRPYCATWHGLATAGSACETVVSAPGTNLAYSECGQGLACLSGICVDPCNVNGLPSLGEPCPEGLCVEGAVCDTSDPANPVCVSAPPLPGPGDPCEGGQCDPKLAVCEPSLDVCAALPGIGEDCIQGQCVPTAACDPNTNTCVGLPPLICTSLGGS